MNQTEASIEALLSERRVIPPPPEFSALARVSDESIYAEADADYEGFWAARAEELSWFTKWDQVL